MGVFCASSFPIKHKTGYFVDVCILHKDVVWGYECVCVQWLDCGRLITCESVETIWKLLSTSLERIEFLVADHDLLPNHEGRSATSNSDGGCALGVT